MSRSLILSRFLVLELSLEMKHCNPVAQLIYTSKKKDNIYLALSQANNLEFLPIIFENTGRMHPKTETFLDGLCLTISMQEAELGNLIT